MIKKLNVSNLAPLPQVELAFANRLNLFTGDNGLGKSFLLDIIWYALTRKWPRELNPQLTNGYKAYPGTKGAEARLRFDITTDNGREIKDYVVTYNAKLQNWIGKPGRPYSSGLVIYAHANGSFSVWDSARNYWHKRGHEDVSDFDDGYAFTEAEVIDGQYKFRKGSDSSQTRAVLRGLIEDLVLWQTQNSDEYKMFARMLKQLSPEGAKLELAPPRRVFMDDFRDYPFLLIEGYASPIPIIFASSAIRRILSLAYVTVWAISENRKASAVLGDSSASQITFLFDEIESHLHPKWQRSVMNALIESIGESVAVAGDAMFPRGHIQMLATTHSPLVMSSLEDVFVEGEDAWFDLDLDPVSHGVVAMRHDVYDRYLTAENWLLSEAFDLKATCSQGKERLLADAADLMKSLSGADANGGIPIVEELRFRQGVREIYPRLLSALDPRDPFLFRFRCICDQKGIAYK